MSHDFRVLEVFRPPQRRGTVLVGELPAVDVSVGTKLVPLLDLKRRFEVIAVDFPTPTGIQERRLAIVVTPDAPDLLIPGALFRVVNR
jgi:hypothetical protein